MSRRPKIIIHVAGHDFHPVYEQAAMLASWLGSDCWCHRAESLAAFEHLSECDLLIFLGMYFTGWEGRYRSPGAVHKRNLEKYITSGKPLILTHGSIVSYDNWPRFGQLTGFSWPAGVRSFAPEGEYPVRLAQDPHPMIQDLKDYTVYDAPPYDVQVAADMRTRVLAHTQWEDDWRPIILAGEGGRAAGTGKVAYIGHGHDLRSLEHPMIQRLWINTVAWCLVDRKNS